MHALFTHFLLQCIEIWLGQQIELGHAIDIYCPVQSCGQLVQPLDVCIAILLLIISLSMRIPDLGQFMVFSSALSTEAAGRGTICALRATARDSRRTRPGVCSLLCANQYRGHSPQFVC